MCARACILWLLGASLTPCATDVTCPECRECVVRQLFRYGWGRHELGVDPPVIQAVLERFRDSQFRFKELMISLVSAYALGN